MYSRPKAILLTSKSISHTKARKNACLNGARIASLPGATQDMIARCIDIDYSEMKKLTTKLSDIFRNSKKVRVITKLGTDITIPVPV